MAAAKYPETAWHTTAPRQQVPEALRSAVFVFVRHGARRTPLTRPYDGPFRVLEKGEKFFHIKVGAKEQVVTVDRLKPALQIRRPGAAVRGEEEGSQARRPEERDQEVSEPGGGEFHPGFKAQGEAVDRVQVEVRPHPPTPRKTGSKIKTVRCLFTRRQVSKGRRQRGVFAFVTFLCFVSEAGRVERQFQRTFIFLLNSLQ